jgi:hypothetical protein
MQWRLKSRPDAARNVSGPSRWRVVVCDEMAVGARTPAGTKSFDPSAGDRPSGVGLPQPAVLAAGPKEPAGAVGLLLRCPASLRQDSRRPPRRLAM